MTPDVPPRPASVGSIESLDGAACLALLGRHRLCILNVIDDGVPYAVPLFYGFDGTDLYLGLAEGRKTRALDANPALCVVVAETGGDGSWASVQVTGRAEWLLGEARRSAVEVLTEHNHRVRSLQNVTDATVQSGSAPQGQRHSGGRVLRVAEAVVTGRRRP